MKSVYLIVNLIIEPQHLWELGDIETSKMIQQLILLVISKNHQPLT